MRFIPTTGAEVAEMLATIGVERISDLFDPIPERFRLNRPLELPPALCEWALIREMEALARANEGVSYASFLGGGAYSHISSVVIDALISRSEFLTAYTPYQPEVSQGTLQAIFEFQGFVCALLDMEVANASVYDAASGLAEACLMADRALKRKARKRIVVSETVHPEYRRVVATYLEHSGIDLELVPMDARGMTDLAALAQAAARGVSGVVVQSPNYLGLVEDLRQARSVADAAGALLVVAISEPVSLGILEPPGSFGADVVVAEGQSFGIPLSFGGPYVGLFATRDKYVRAMPGRIVGATVDREGEPGFVLTLSTREQHIRREKATSNICTNQGLCALAATIYLSLLGKRGLPDLAQRNLSHATWLRRAISALDGFEIAFDGPVFNEFAVRSKRVPVATLLERLEAHRILGGIPLGEDYPHLDDCWLVTATETATRADMERFVNVLDKEGRQ